MPIPVLPGISSLESFLPLLPTCRSALHPLGICALAPLNKSHALSFLSSSWSTSLCKNLSTLSAPFPKPTREFRSDRELQLETPSSPPFLPLPPPLAPSYPAPVLREMRPNRGLQLGLSLPPFPRCPLFGSPPFTFLPHLLVPSYPAPVLCKMRPNLWLQLWLSLPPFPVRPWYLLAVAH